MTMRDPHPLGFQLDNAGRIIDERVGWTEVEYTEAPALASRLHRRILDLEDTHKVTLGFLEKLIAWGFGADAPKLAQRDWAEALAWLEKARRDG